MIRSRFLILVLALIMPIAAYSQENSSLDYFIYVQKLFEAGEYNLALRGFQFCMENHRADIPVAKCEQYIAECNSRIEKNRQATIEARRARERAAAAERAAIEERQAARLRNKLVYIKTDAWTLDAPYSQYASSIIEQLEEAGYHFTDNQEDALWSVYITAATSKRAPDEINTNYIVDVTAFYKIVYEQDLSIPPGGEGRRVVSGRGMINYSIATEAAYGKLCEPICDAIKKVIK